MIVSNLEHKQCSVADEKISRLCLVKDGDSDKGRFAFGAILSEKINK